MLWYNGTLGNITCDSDSMHHSTLHYTMLHYSTASCQIHDKMDKKKKWRRQEVERREKEKEKIVLIKFHSWSGSVKFDFLNSCWFHPFA